MYAPQQPVPRGSRVRRWLGHLFREWTIESWRPIAPAFARPEPWKWSDTQVTLAWLGHSTVLINFFGVTILTDPVLFARVGIRLPGITIGPKRPKALQRCGDTVQSTSQSCLSARTIRGSNHTARLSRQSRWRMLQALALLRQCTIRRSDSALSPSANRSSASKPR